METEAYKLSSLIVFLRENQLFQRGWGVFVTLVEIPKWWGLISSLQKWKIQGGGGSQVKFPPWWGSGYFLELHIYILVRETIKFKNKL